MRWISYIAYGYFHAMNVTATPKDFLPIKIFEEEFSMEKCFNLENILLVKS